MSYAPGLICWECSPHLDQFLQKHWCYWDGISHELGVFEGEKHILVIQGAIMLIEMFFFTNCVRRDRISPKTPAFAAQYRCKGGVSRKLAADPVKTI